MKKMVKAIAAIAAAGIMSVAALAGAAQAAHRSPAPVPGRQRGIVLAHGARQLTARGGQRSPARRRAATPLTYHGGPVMRVNTTEAIYWVPAGTSMITGYQSTITQYFADAAHDSGGVANVYSTETQYYDGTGSIAYSQTFGGAIVDTNPFPANGCPVYSGVTSCLTDAQIGAEVQNVVTANHLPVDGTHAYFLFTPKGVGSCFSATSTTCAFTYYCAYHSNSGSLLYANMPYADTSPNACGTGQRPNGNEADDTLNVTSHEHREMINDPYGNAWFDRRGYEGSDKCAWNFGSALGSTTTGAYNQVINGHFYFLQQEWSNVRLGCVQRGT